jgi:membrane associated rhomboid family serine protease
MIFPLGDNIQKRHFPVVVVLLICFNVLVFIYQERLWIESQKRHPEPIQLLNQEAWFDWYQNTDYWKFILRWGLVPKNVDDGKHYDSMITHMFMHGDILHIFNNMLMFWAIAGTLENTLGSVKFGFLYLFWGWFAALVDVLVTPDSTIPSIGASAAIAGVMGAYFVAFGAFTHIRVLFLWRLSTTGRGNLVNTVNVPTVGFMVFWLVLQFIGMEQEEQYGDSGVGWMAHLSGFAIGAATMFLFKGEVQRRIARDDKSGMLAVVATEEETKAADAQAPAVPEGPKIPQECPQCKEPLTEEHKIADKMMRCPNPNCQKLILVSDPADSVPRKYTKRR